MPQASHSGKWAVYPATSADAAKRFASREGSVNIANAGKTADGAAEPQAVNRNQKRVTPWKLPLKPPSLHPSRKSGVQIRFLTGHD